MKTALGTIPLIGRLPMLHNDYHNKRVSMTDGFTEQRIGSDHVSTKWTDSGAYAADREASEVMPFVERPVTVAYPYERLEDLEPWLFVPGEYNGRIGIIWETCTACKACVRACPNDCLHMTSETRSTCWTPPLRVTNGMVMVRSRSEALQPYQRRTQQKQRRLI